MVSFCAAYNCSNRRIRGSGRTFHKFPIKNEALLKKWIKATRRLNFTPSRHQYICSDHFDEECFLQNYVNIRKLRDDAIPTIFDFTDHGVKPVLKKQRTSKTRVLRSPVGDASNPTSPENNGSTGITYQDLLLEPAVKKRRTPKTRVLPRTQEVTSTETFPGSNDWTGINPVFWK